MELKDWLNLLNVLVVPAVITFFGWYTTKYLPKIWAQETRLDEANIRKLEDTREFKQEGESESLGQVIKINETVVSALIRMIDDLMRDRKNEKQETVQAIANFTGVLTRVQGELQKIVTNTDLHTREWSRMVEVETDIEMLLHELKGMMQVNGTIEGNS